MTIRRNKRPGQKWQRGDRVLIYIRVSQVGNRQDTLISDDVQEDVCRKWAEREGLTVVGEPIVDLDLSGRESTKRKIAKSIDRVARDEADGIVVWKVSRWGRNLVDSMLNVVALQEAGGFIGSATENLEDIETPMGRFSLTQMLAIAQLQSDQIGETWRNVQDYRVTRGLPRNGHNRWGYIRNEIGRDDDPAGAYSIHPIQGPWLEKAYRDFVAGRSLYAITMEMREAGVTSNTGRVLQSSALRRAMDSGFAAGLLVDRRQGGYTSSGMPKTTKPYECQYTEGAQPRIIERDLWDQYVLRRSEKRAPRAVRVAHKMAGLVYCASCGGRLIILKVNSGKPSEYRAYKCPKTRHNPNSAVICPKPTMIKVDYVEDAVLRWLRDTTQEEQAYYSAVLREREAVRAKADLDGIDKRIESQSALRARYLDMKVEAVDKAERLEMDSRRAELRVEIEDLTRQRKKLAQQNATTHLPELAAFGALAAVWEHAEIEIVNGAIQKLVRAVYIHRSPDMGTARLTGGPDRVQMVGMWEELPAPLEQKITLKAVPDKQPWGVGRTELESRRLRDFGLKSTSPDAAHVGRSS